MSNNQFHPDSNNPFSIGTTSEFSSDITPTKQANHEQNSLPNDPIQKFVVSALVTEKENSALEKEKIKILRNRQHAKKSNDKRKARILQLEADVKDLEDQLQQVSAQNDAIEAENFKLQLATKQLQ